MPFKPDEKPDKSDADENDEGDFGSDADPFGSGAGTDEGGDESIDSVSDLFEDTLLDGSSGNGGVIVACGENGGEGGVLVRSRLPRCFLFALALNLVLFVGEAFVGILETLLQGRRDVVAGLGRLYRLLVFIRRGGLLFYLLLRCLTFWFIRFPACGSLIEQAAQPSEVNLPGIAGNGYLKVGTDPAALAIVIAAWQEAMTASRARKRAW